VFSLITRTMGMFHLRDILGLVSAPREQIDNDNISRLRCMDDVFCERLYDKLLGWFAVYSPIDKRHSLNRTSFMNPDGHPARQHLPNLPSSLNLILPHIIRQCQNCWKFEKLPELPLKSCAFCKRSHYCASSHFLQALYTTNDAPSLGTEQGMSDCTLAPA
jgi:hypothetical protein